MAASAPRLGALACLLSLASAGPLVSGCESAEEKCELARGEAEKTWSSYVSSLEASMEDARDTERTGKEQMGKIEQRLAEPVKQDADRRYERAGGAWMRAFQSGLHKACTQDEECSELKQRVARAADTLEDFAERLGPAQRARDATHLSVDEAKQASEAVEIHMEYPVVKAAQGTTLELFERCKDLPPPKHAP